MRRMNTEFCECASCEASPSQHTQSCCDNAIASALRAAEARGFQRGVKRSAKVAHENRFKSGYSLDGKIRALLSPKQGGSDE